MTLSVHDMKLEMSLALVPSPTKLPQVRSFVRLQLRWWGLEEGVVDDALVVVGELLANVVKHVGEGECGLALRVGDGVLHVRVRDGSSVLSAVKWPSAYGVRECEEGRGLLIVDRLTGGAWGAERSPGGGKVVFGRLSLGVERDASHWHAFYWAGSGLPTRGEETDPDSSKPPAVNDASAAWVRKPASLHAGQLADIAACVAWLEARLADDRPVARIPARSLVGYAQGELDHGLRKLPLQWSTLDGRIVRLMLLACPSRSRAFRCPGPVAS
ncbi:ATP-binding protein [Streptomyces huiliensis]|uniref:ATP-binding protein n=1 Tax=Streptomyces huiliensis TaxID=2876027 RepID=UPI001CBD424A|nr:ATP-binding protein [Streptomyces huiliensis]MBZ4318934.1 ATP-binding protein [Streptomyces huiliensis]